MDQIIEFSEMETGKPLGSARAIPAGYFADGHARFVVFSARKFLIGMARTVDGARDLAMRHEDDWQAMLAWGAETPFVPKDEPACPCDLGGEASS